MAANLGSLTVALGLDAADYTRGLTKAERDAHEFGREIGEQIRSGAVIATGALTALGVAAERSFAYIRSQAGAIDAFNDLRDATGSSIENISALDKVARQTGGTFATAETVLLKFNTALSAAKPNSEAEAALKALNLNIGELKALDPAEALRRTSVAFAQFETDANKARAMQILFGKSVKEVAPFLGDLAEQTELVGSTSAATAAQAEMFNKQIDMLKANAEDAGRSIVSNLLPALNQFMMNAKQIQQIGGFGVIVKDAAREFVGMDPLMTGDNGADIRRAMKERDRLQKDLAWQQGKGRPTRSVEDSLAENARLLGVLRIKQKNEVDMLNFGQDYGDAVSRRFEQAAKLPEILKPPKIAKGSKGNAAAEARAALGLDLDAIRTAADEQLNVFRNAERLLSAERSAGLKDESAYYAERIRLSQQTTATQEDAARMAIERLQQERLTGKDAIDNARQIAQEQAKLTKLQTDGATAVKVLGIEQAAAYAKTEASILSARQAAQDYFDTTNRGYARQLAGLGQGNKYREYFAGLQAVEEQYLQQRQRLANQRQQAEQNGTFTDQARTEYERLLEQTNEFQAKAVDSYKATYADIEDAQKNWLVGASEALRNYADEAANIAKQTEQTVGNALKGLEDQFTNLFTGKGFDAKKLLTDLQGDLTRDFVKQNITGPLAGWLGDSFGFNTAGMTGAKLGTQQNPMYVRMTDSMMGLTGALTGGKSGGDWMSTVLGAAGSLFGGFSTGTAASLANALPGDSLDNLFKLTGNFGGGRALGGPVTAGRFYEVNENGPELLDVNGKQMLMMGNRGGRVTPMDEYRGEGGFRQSVNITVPGNVDRRTADQIATAVGRHTRMATMRLS